jgi:hypothetical protein
MNKKDRHQNKIRGRFIKVGHRVIGETKTGAVFRIGGKKLYLVVSPCGRGTTQEGRYPKSPQKWGLKLKRHRAAEAG